MGYGLFSATWLLVYLMAANVITEKDSVVFCSQVAPPVPVRVLDIAPDIACATVTHIDRKRLTVTGKLGEGGYGVVWKATYEWDIREEDSLARMLAGSDGSLWDWGAKGTVGSLAKRRKKGSESTSSHSPTPTSISGSQRRRPRNRSAFTTRSPNDSQPGGTIGRRYEGITLLGDSPASRFGSIASRFAQRGSSIDVLQSLPDSSSSSPSGISILSTRAAGEEGWTEEHENYSGPSSYRQRTLSLQRVEHKPHDPLKDGDDIARDESKDVIRATKQSKAGAHRPIANQLSCRDMHTTFSPVVVAPTSLLPCGFVLVRSSGWPT